MLGSILGAISQGLIWGVMAIGVYITYKVINISDLTVDGSFATGGAVFAVLVLNKVDPTISLLLAFLAGGICGLITGLIHTIFKIPAILAGILTQLSLYSINLRILGDKANVSINFIETNITFLSKRLGITHSQSGMLLGFIVCVICILVIYYFLGTEMGVAFRATGNNEKMVRALGVNTSLVKVCGVSLSNALVGLSGALLVQMSKYADVSMGKGAIVYGLASIVIGNAIFIKATNFGIKLFSSVVGCIIFFIIRAVVIRLGLKANDMQLISAVIVVIALGLPEIKKVIFKNR